VCPVWEEHTGQWKLIKPKNEWVRKQRDNQKNQGLDCRSEKE
jgi:hypothetical protein